MSNKKPQNDEVLTSKLKIPVRLRRPGNLRNVRNGYHSIVVRSLTSELAARLGSLEHFRDFLFTILQLKKILFKPNTYML